MDQPRAHALNEQEGEGCGVAREHHSRVHAGEDRGQRHEHRVRGGEERVGAAAHKREREERPQQEDRGGGRAEDVPCGSTWAAERSEAVGCAAADKS